MASTNFNLGIYVDDRLASTSEIISGKLPAGLEITYGHFLKGKATESGTFPFTLRSTYTFLGRTSTATGSFTITVLKNPDITKPSISGSFTDGELNEPYSSKIYAADGDYDSYEWDYDGTLPDGLYLSAAGDTYELVGTPTKADEYTFTVYLWDKYEPENGKASETFTVNITDGTPPPAALAINGSLSTGTINERYSSALTASGGTAPYEWDYDEEELPEGLSFSASGTTLTISGTPTESGDFPVTVYLEDDNENSVGKTFTLKISDKPKTPSEYSVDEFMDGIVGLEYEDFFVATGGTAPYEWYYEGELPPGINAWTSGTNNQYLTLKGTPTKGGVYSFSIVVTDKNKKYDQKDFSITITDISDKSEEEQNQAKSQYDVDSNTTLKNKESSTGGAVDRTENVNNNGFQATNLEELIKSLKDIHVEHDVSLGSGCELGFGIFGLMIIGAGLIRRFR